MNYAVEALRIGKEPVDLVEIDLDWITSATSAINADGTPCYDTPSTCDDPAATIGTRTRRYHTTSQQPLRGLASYAAVESVSLGTETMQIGDGLSQFGQATVQLRDWDDADQLEDPHWSSRTYPRLASYWRRLIARNPYVQGRAMRIRRGYRSDGRYDAVNFKTYTYLIRSLTGPRGSRVTLVGCSPLQLINLNKAQVPAPTAWRLATDIDDSQTTATLATDTYDDGSDPATGFVRVNDEVCTFSRSGATLSLTRGQRGTTASQHGANDSIQLCLRYQSQSVDAILDDLLTLAGVDAAYIPAAEWSAEVDRWMPGFTVTDVLISEPTDVLDLVREVLAIVAGVMWWDAEAAALQLRIIRPALGQFAATWSDSRQIMQQIDRQVDIRDRISRADVLMDLRTPVADAEMAISYRLRLIGRSSGAGATEHGSEQVRIYASRWLDRNQISRALRASITYAGMLRDGRISFDVAVPASAATVGLAEVIRLQSRDLVDTTGQPKSVLAIVVRREERIGGSQFRYSLEFFPWEGRFIYLNDTTDPGAYALATEAERDPGWYLSDTDGRLPGGDPPYLLG